MANNSVNPCKNNHLEQEITSLCSLRIAALGLSLSAVNSLVSTYATFLGATAVLVGMLTGMFFGVAFAMRPISGPVVTKFDKKKLIIFANAARRHRQCRLRPF